MESIPKVLEAQSSHMLLAETSENCAPENLDNEGLGQKPYVACRPRHALVRLRIDNKWVAVKPHGGTAFTEDKNRERAKELRAAKLAVRSQANSRTHRDRRQLT